MGYSDPEARRRHNRAYYHRNGKDKILAANKASRLRNKEYVDRIKTENPCLDCGNYFPAICMDFDHLPGFDKHDNVAELTRGGCSIETIDAEIAKCELVCSNCHRIRTLNRLEELTASSSVW